MGKLKLYHRNVNFNGLKEAIGKIEEKVMKT